MAVWQENLRRLLRQKEVLILHGNVRDSAYIRGDGTLLSGLSELLIEVGRSEQFQKIHFWGIVSTRDGKIETPLWTIERIEALTGGEGVNIIRNGGNTPELQQLGRWLQDGISDIKERHLFVINYIDQLTPYYEKGAHPAGDRAALALSMVLKIIENITPNNRLIMIALSDTMIPMEYYTQSPKVALMKIPQPDKEERYSYFSSLSSQAFSNDQLEFLSNITDGLYVRDLQNIKRDILKERERTEAADISFTQLRKLVNRYRIGIEDDPWAKLPLRDPSKGLLDNAVIWFKKRIIGQDHAVEAVVKAIKNARAGVVGLASGQGTKPRAIFFFAGPTGVGKTFLAKKLAEYLFDSEDAFIRFDMSEFKEEHTVSKLIGSPPGYVGYEKGGMLTEAIMTRPFSVILFDEIEKAHPKIMDIFLQILDDGRLTDSRGQTVFFTESVIIFTSNIGTRTTTADGQRPVDEKRRLEEIFINFKDPDERAKKIREHFIQAVRDFFTYEISRPELLNRIGSNIIAFNYIDNQEAQIKIIKGKLDDMSLNFRDRFSASGHKLIFDDSVSEHFFNKYKDHIAIFGGRGLVNALENEISSILAEQVLNAESNNQRGVNFKIYLDSKGVLRCQRMSGI